MYLMDTFKQHINNPRQLHLLKKALQGILLKKYFTRKQKTEYNFGDLKYNSVRGQVVRKLLKCMKQKMAKKGLCWCTYPSAAELRRLAFGLEKAVHDRYVEREEYTK